MADTRAATGGQPGSSKGGFLAFWTTLPGILTGVAALLTAIVALIGLWQTAGGEATVPSADRGSAPGASPTSATPTAPGDAPARQVVEGQLTMADEDSANLTERRVGQQDPEADLYLHAAATDFAEIYAPYGGFLAPTQGPASKSTCVDALNGRRDDREPLSTLVPGSWLCMQTHAGHIAALKIVSLPAVGNPRLVFTYTLWRVD